MRAAVVHMAGSARTSSTLGSEWSAGVHPEGLQISAGPNGVESFTFDLRRNPAQEWPDLVPFTPVTVYIEGQVAAQGRIQETPTRRGGGEDLISVVCEGWIGHLADNAVQKTYVNADMTSWQDQHQWYNVSAGVSEDLTVVTGPAGNTRRGLPSIGWPSGVTINIGSRSGILLDMGQFQTCSRVVVAWTRYGGAINANLIARATSDGKLAGSAANDVFTKDLNAVASGATEGSGATFGTPQRYVHLFIDKTVAAATPVIDHGVFFTSIQAYTSTTYESGGASTLKASNVISDVLATAPLVSSATDKITVTSFSIPHLVGDLATPRDYIDAVNAYHAYSWNILDDANGAAPRLQYRPVQTVPTLIARVGDGIQFDDASRNDGSDIYNRCLVEYTDPAGMRQWADRTQTGTVVDKQSFTRCRTIQVSAPMVAATANQIGDTFLAAHRSTPLRGTLTVQGASIRTYQGDAPVPPHLLARRVGDAIIINETDPDTSALGRVGTIAGVQYDHPSDTATLTIDTRRDFIDAILARF